MPGNVGSPIQRLPLFRKLLLSQPKSSKLDVTIIAIPPRSFGRSTYGTPTQDGILQDYRAVAEHVTAISKDRPHKIIFMGHSLGASIATVLLGSSRPEGGIRCDGLVFENGFSSIPDMVRALYPHRALPYHYLGPLVLDRWDAKTALKQSGREDSLFATVPILFVSSSNDELVPPEMMRELYETAVEARSSGSQGQIEGDFSDGEVENTYIQWLVVPDGLHDFAWQKSIWSATIWSWLSSLSTR